MTTKVEETSELNLDETSAYHVASLPPADIRSTQPAIKDYDMIHQDSSGTELTRDNPLIKSPPEVVAQIEIPVGIQHAIDPSNYSSLNKLLRVTALVRRFVSILKHKDNVPREQVTADEINQSETEWIKQIQNDRFDDTITSLRGNNRKYGPLVKQLKLFIDDDGILHCGGRIHNAPIEFATKFPILLPNGHPFTNLIIRHDHVRLKHSGAQTIITSLRQRYWIPQIRRAVNSIIRKCVTCRRVDGKPYQKPLTAPLPDYRINMVPPFAVTGVDFTSPLFVKSTNNEETKSYVCLFTCAVSRAVHLELVPDLTTRSFMMAFRRFAARRSLPSKMLSDNASTYLSAADELHDLMNSQEVKDLLAEHRVTWTFIPKRAPWHGGFWERLIGLTKTTIKKVLGRAFVTFDELRTLLTEIEATLNDRPLTYVSTNEDDPIALTPSHLLHGRPLTTLPYISVDDEERNDPSYGNHNALNERYRHLSHLQSNFWKRWSTEYLTALRERHRLTATGIKTNYIQIGDIVLVHNDVD
ncbi:uncharacterized protein [Ptychodera flava]|uniref:uncharacterized protein n=1 Tax=Ptychodera flava TaxID=63121 RepID=UPI003969C447